MKANRKFIGFAGFLAIAIGSQAAQITTFDWQFTNDASNPAAPTATVSPSGTAALLTVEPGFETPYYSGNYLNDSNFGSQTGIFASGDGSYKIDLNGYTANPAASLTYTLSIVEMVGKDIFAPWYPGTPHFSLLGAQQTAHELQAGGGGFASWYKDTYTWTVTPGANSPLSLTIFPATGTSLVIDQIQFRVDGDLSLVAVPEPMLATSLTAIGLAAFGFYRRQKKA